MNEREKKYCKSFGEALRHIRLEETGKSSFMFAYENDIPRSTLSRIERGENEVQLVTLKKIAEGFGYSLAQLFEKLEAKMPDAMSVFDEEHY